VAQASQHQQPTIFFDIYNLKVVFAGVRWKQITVVTICVTDRQNSVKPTFWCLAVCVLFCCLFVEFP
jgi:hypothetical protein